MKDIVSVEMIEQRIFVIRGQRIMLSPHLAELYGVETRVLIQAVKRNIERFPADFMFSLSRREIRDISQIVMSPHIKHAPMVYAFTEQGIAMLSSVLRSKQAVRVNIAIMRAFVKLREIFSTHKELAHKLAELERRVESHDTDIQAIFEAIRQLMASPVKPKRRIGFSED